MSRLPRERTDALVNPGGAAPRARIPYPSPADVLYDPPNPDGTRKGCYNCYKFHPDATCTEVAGTVLPTQVCGLYVHGTAVEMTAAQPPAHGPATKVLPQFAGLVDTAYGDGASCDTCRFFARVLEIGDGGLCNALGATDGLPPVVVDARGCCARWQIDPTAINDG